MKTQKIIAGAVIIFCFPFLSLVSAHTPQDISVTADFAAEQLQISIKHTKVSSNDYIKKVEIVVDDDEPIEKKFHFQRTSYQNFSLRIINLKDVKKVIIRAYPTRGKFLEKEFDIQSLRNESETKDAAKGSEG